MEVTEFRKTLRTSGLKIDELVKLSGVSKSCITKLSSGARNNCTVDTMRKLQKGFAKAGINSGAAA